MSDTENLLESDHEGSSGVVQQKPRPPAVKSYSVPMSIQNNPDLVDTFDLFKTYFDETISTLQKDLSVGNDNFAKKIKQEVSVKFKGEGNQIQFNFNADIIADLVKLQQCIPDEDCASSNLISGGNLQPTIPVITVTRTDIGGSDVPFSAQNQASTHQDRSSEINDKYFLLDYANLNFQCEMFLSHARYFDQIDASYITKGVKNSLRKHVQFWEHISANQSVIDTIKKGYVIPFLQNPPSMSFRNNKSAFLHSEFVDGALKDLLDTGCIIKTPFQPFVVNPLSVAVKSSGKKRLILDLSKLNLFIKKDKVKFEDWRVALNYFSRLLSV